MTRSIRIGNAQAFWGDRSDAAAELLAQEPDLDYLTMDYLAEVSMSILASQRERDPQAGFAADFIDVIRSLAAYWSAGGRCRLIVNAGGLNPRGCGEACRRALETAGCRRMRIGIVSGDNVLETIVSENISSHANAVARAHYRNLDTAADISDVADRLVTANAYLGAPPIVAALADGADIVITGRVADPSLVVGACLHHFGWSDGDYDRLAGATVAGHLIECGTQVTGGISTAWLDVPDPAHIGFPVVEIADDGSCIVGKPRGSGGCVNQWTVKEQLLYEIGDPSKYLSPDVTVSFLSLQVEDLGSDRVVVRGAKGTAPPSAYKVSATYRDGFRAAGTLTVVGRDAVAKARRCGALVLHRVREAGFELRDSLVECLGTGALANTADTQTDGFPELIETVLRVAVEAESSAAVERFSRELIPFVTAGPQGTTGYAEGRPRVQRVFRYWPCLIARQAVTPQVELIETTAVADDTLTEQAPTTAGATGAALAQPRRAELAIAEHRQPRRRPNHRGPFAMRDIAVARSGDKGISANVGVIALTSSSWAFLQQWLTAERVAQYFMPLGLDSVERFELPNLGGLNFLLHGILRNGLRTDAQGKTLGQLLLEMPLPDSPQLTEIATHVTQQENRPCQI